jgi:hypothetical protein
MMILGSSLQFMGYVFKEKRTQERHTDSQRENERGRKKEQRLLVVSFDIQGELQE